MKLKFLFYLSLLLTTSSVCAKNEKLSDYEMIKSSVLNGSTIKMVVDLKNHCKLILDDTNGGPPTVLNILVRTLTKFSIKENTKYIMSMKSIMGAGDETYPGNYQTAVLYIRPDNQVELEHKIVALPSYKVIKHSRFLCAIENNNSPGIRFTKASLQDS